MPRPCGNEDCSISTGIDDIPTFGRGELDDNGFWEVPCNECARAWEKNHPEDGKCWPRAVKQEEYDLDALGLSLWRIFGVSETCDNKVWRKLANEVVVLVNSSKKPLLF